MGAGKRLLAAICLLFLAALVPGRALAEPAFPTLTGRVVDAANIIPDDEAARLDQKLAALEAQSGRQLVVATIPDLQGYEISDYGYQLGRAWGIGSRESNNGALLIVAPNEHKVRIEVGYGLEGVLTDGMSFMIINQQILPRFKQGDIAGGIEAGADAIIQQLTLPADQAQQIAQQANAQAKRSRADDGGFPVGLIFPAGFILLFVVLPMLRGGRRRRRGFDGGLGPIILWDAMSHMGGRGGGWGSGGGGGGGFSGGGGGFGGGGASGGW